MADLKYIIESLLFVSDAPISIDRIKQVVDEPDGAEIRKALNSLAAEYEERKGGFYLSEVANGFQIRTRPEFTPWIKRLIKPGPTRVSRAALETLAIIAYKQPVIRSDIEHIRGVDSGGVIRQLLERKLIRVLGRKEIPGRPLIYATTKKFLEVFGLKNLRDLPSPKEIEEIGTRTLNTDEQETEGRPVSEPETRGPAYSTELDMDSDTEPDSDPDPDPDPDSDSDSDTDPETDSDTDLDPDPDSDPDTDTDPDTDLDPDTDPGLDTDSDTDTDTDTDTDPRDRENTPLTDGESQVHPSNGDNDNTD